MAGRRYLYQPLRRLDFAFSFNSTGMVDGGSTVGTFTPTNIQLPIGAVVQGTRLKVIEAFIGDTTAIATVGKAGATDDFFGAAQSIFTIPTSTFLYGLPATIAEMQASVAALTTPIVTITSTADFTAVTAGKLLVHIYYLDFNSKAV